MTNNMTIDEETKEASPTRTTRFANWLMEREEKRQDKETSLEGLMRFNIFLSTVTLVGLFGTNALNYALMIYAWI